MDMDYHYAQCEQYEHRIAVGVRQSIFNRSSFSILNTLMHVHRGTIEVFRFWFNIVCLYQRLQILEESSAPSLGDLDLLFLLVGDNVREMPVSMRVLILTMVRKFHIFRTNSKHTM